MKTLKTRKRKYTVPLTELFVCHGEGCMQPESTSETDEQWAKRRYDDYWDDESESSGLTAPQEGWGVEVYVDSWDTD